MGRSRGVVRHPNTGKWQTHCRKDCFNLWGKFSISATRMLCAISYLLHLQYTSMCLQTVVFLHNNLVARAAVFPALLASSQTLFGFCQFFHSCHVF